MGKSKYAVAPMKRKQGCLIAMVGALVVLGGLFLTVVVYRRTHVTHQQPYKWDSYVRPDQHFTMEPMSNVIVKMNRLIRELSKNAVPEAIKLDTTPTSIIKVHANQSLDLYMNQLIADYRENEIELNAQGAEGFEGTPFTGYLEGHHSLWCTLVGPREGGLHWEAKEDALHVSRMPRMMECRPYYVADTLFVRMKQQRSENRYKVDAEPIVSAFIEETGINSWVVMIRDGTSGGMRSEYRYDKVFKYIPDLKVILALAIPEEHAEAERRLMASGLWIESVSVTKQEVPNNEALQKK